MFLRKSRLVRKLVSLLNEASKSSFKAPPNSCGTPPSSNEKAVFKSLKLANLNFAWKGRDKNGENNLKACNKNLVKKQKKSKVFLKVYRLEVRLGLNQHKMSNWKRKRLHCKKPGSSIGNREIGWSPIAHIGNKHVRVRRCKHQLSVSHQQINHLDVRSSARKVPKTSQKQKKKGGGGESHLAGCINKMHLLLESRNTSGSKKST
jgi:hypothetical protein